MFLRLSLIYRTVVRHNGMCHIKTRLEANRVQAKIALKRSICFMHNGRYLDVREDRAPFSRLTIILEVGQAALECMVPEAGLHSLGESPTGSRLNGNAVPRHQLTPTLDAVRRRASTKQAGEPAPYTT